jgi:hypothetical protein
MALFRLEMKVSGHDDFGAAVVIHLERKDLIDHGGQNDTSCGGQPGR